MFMLKQTLSLTITGWHWSHGSNISRCIWTAWYGNSRPGELLHSYRWRGNVNIQWSHFLCLSCYSLVSYLYLQVITLYFCSLCKVEQNWATLQGGEMTIQTTQASEATQAVASLAEAAVAASQEMQSGATVTMALNRYSWEVIVWESYRKYHTAAVTN